jgi:hypothetical protein
MTGDSVDVLRAPAIRFRPAHHQHTVYPFPQGAWTILITGRPLRKFGFYWQGKFIKANKWFLSHGHHPCDLFLDCHRWVIYSVYDHATAAEQHGYRTAEDQEEAQA